MQRDEIIYRLKQHEGAIRKLGAASLYLYGSHVRDEARNDSDIDLFVDKDPQKKFGFLEYTGLIIMLEDLFGRSVDVSTRTSLHPVLRAGIEATAVKVF
jgi:predicted nucleotidyltransferase